MIMVIYAPSLYNSKIIRTVWLHSQPNLLALTIEVRNLIIYFAMQLCRNLIKYRQFVYIFRKN